MLMWFVLSYSVSLSSTVCGCGCLVAIIRCYPQIAKSSSGIARDGAIPGAPEKCRKFKVSKVELGTSYTKCAGYQHESWIYSYDILDLLLQTQAIYPAWGDWFFYLEGFPHYLTGRKFSMSSRGVCFRCGWQETVARDRAQWVFSSAMELSCNAVNPDRGISLQNHVISRVLLHHPKTYMEPEHHVFQPGIFFARLHFQIPC